MKQLTTLLLILLALIMSACSAGENTAADAAAQTEDILVPISEEILTIDYENAASLRNQLALGVLALNETSQALTAEQAVELLPLWQAMSLLEQDQNSAQVEIEALQTQLIKSMTIEQLQAIADLSLTNDDLAEYYAEQGIEMGAQSEESQGMQGGNKDMTEAERAAFRATRQASEAGDSSGSGGSGRARRNVLTDEVITLLTQRIGE